MQSLYELDFRGEAADYKVITERNINEFRKDVDETYVWKVVDGCLASMTELNALIMEAAPEWPIEQVAKVDKAILRVALFEMLFDTEEDVPPRVSINEAIEIGKTFGGESSPKFINGVLGSVYRKFESKLAPRDAKQVPHAPQP
jgi:N utilization substance protein B